jgi:hypothetical protein
MVARASVLTRWGLAHAALALGAGCAGVEVRGAVWCGESHRPIAGAIVRIADEEATTDLDGAYRLTVAPREEDRPVVVGAAGHATLREWRPVGETSEPIWHCFELAPRRAPPPAPPRSRPPAPPSPAGEEPPAGEEAVTAGSPREPGPTLPAGALRE